MVVADPGSRAAKKKRLRRPPRRDETPTTIRRRRGVKNPASPLRLDRRVGAIPVRGFEVVRHEPYDASCAVWSFGVMLDELIAACLRTIAAPKAARLRRRRRRRRGRRRRLRDGGGPPPGRPRSCASASSATRGTGLRSRRYATRSMRCSPRCFGTWRRRRRRQAELAQEPTGRVHGARRLSKTAATVRESRLSGTPSGRTGRMWTRPRSR